MTAILGIDAAWTKEQPSGIALIQSLEGSKWKCVAIAPSYTSFIELSKKIPVDWSSKPKGEKPNVDSILRAAEKMLVNKKVDLITVDMPLSMKRISGRRKADDFISKEFGNKGCAVHSPNEQRPGRIANDFREEFCSLGFPLATTSTKSEKLPALLEVYPHTALLKLVSVPRRVPYKISKTSKYWPGVSLEDRRKKILGEWEKIREALEKVIDDIQFKPEGDTLSSLKRWEDALDALICAWVGIEYLENHAVAYGDEDAAIWTPELLEPHQTTFNLNNSQV